MKLRNGNTQAITKAMKKERLYWPLS
jgi:hypothetical protein